MNDLPQPPLTFNEQLAVLRGEDLVAHRAEEAFRAALQTQAHAYLGQPPQAWPLLCFNWDLSYTSQRFSLDLGNINDLIDLESASSPQERFHQRYPEGFVAGWVALKEFDAHLCRFSRRDGLQELWSLGDSGKLAYLIAYLSHGYPISPPLVKPLESGELIFQGGHHRYALAKVIGVEEIPIHVLPANQLEVARIVDAAWIEDMGAS
jgi:hypothetical protein